MKQSPVTIGVALVVAGFVLIFLAWNGAAGRDYVEGQLPYLISGGLAGLGLISSGLVVVLVQAQRRETQLLAAQIEELAAALHEAPVARPTLVTSEPGAPMVIAGRSTFHTPTCRLVEGRDDFPAVTVAAAEARGLKPCRVCTPLAA